MRPFLGAFAVAMVTASSVSASTIGLEVQSGSTSNVIIDTTIGWSFSVNRAISLDALGYYDYQGDGLLQSYQVGLWQDDGELLSTATVAAGTASPLIDSFRYSLVAPILLVPGKTYVLGGVANTGFSDTGDRVIDVARITTAPEITFLQNRGSMIESTALLFPDTNFSSQGTGCFGPNLAFEVPPTPRPVPEPETLILTGTGLVVTLARRRNRRTAA